MTGTWGPGGGSVEWPQRFGSGKWKIPEMGDGRWRGLQGSDVAQCPWAVALSMVTIERFILCVVHRQKKHLKKEKSRISIMLQGLRRTFWNFHAKCLSIHPLTFTTSWPKAHEEFEAPARSQSSKHASPGSGAKCRGEPPEALLTPDLRARGRRRQPGLGWATPARGPFRADAGLMFSVQPQDLCWLHWTVCLWTRFRSRCSVLPCGRRRQCSETSWPWRTCRPDIFRWV